MCRATAETFSGGGPYSLFSKAFEKASKSPIPSVVEPWSMIALLGAPEYRPSASGAIEKAQVCFEAISMATRATKKWRCEGTIFVFLRDWKEF